MDDNYEQDYGVIIPELLHAFKERIAWILSIVLFAGAITWSAVSFVMPKQYEASVNLIVNTRLENTVGITSDNLSTAQNLVDTYAIIIKSNIVLEQVISDLKLDMNYEDLYEAVAVDSINNTQVMKIAVRMESIAAARQVVGAIVSVAPAVVTEAVEAGSCKVVSNVYSNPEPVAPNTAMLALSAALLAGLAVCAAITLKELGNDFVVDEVDMEKKIGIPALGVIPDVEG